MTNPDSILKSRDITLPTKVRLVKAIINTLVLKGFPCDLAGKESICNVGYLRSIPGEGKGYPLQYSGLENPLDRGAWQAAVHGVPKSQKRLTFTPFLFT